MALETGTALYSLVDTNPADTDPVAQGAGHLRLIKSVLLSTFAGFTAAANAVLNSTPNQIDAAVGAVSGGAPGLIGAGTAAAPGLGVGTATNGVYAPAANQVGIATNGTAAVTVDATQSVTVAGDLTVNGHIYGDGGVPIGAIMMWMSATPPTGWLICNNQSCTAYPKLVAVLGSNTVPNMTSCAPVMADGSNFGPWGRYGAINVGVPLPYHNHGATAQDYGHGHSASGNTSLIISAGNGAGGPTGVVSGTNVGGTSVGTAVSIGTGYANIGVSVQPTGTSGAVMSVVQPSFGVYFIIRAA